MIPVLYLNRGHTYIFVNTTGTTHPFEIRTSTMEVHTSGVSGFNREHRCPIVPNERTKYFYIINVQYMVEWVTQLIL